MDLWDFVLDLIGKGGPILLVPSGLLNQSNSLVFVPLCDGFLFCFWCTWLLRFYELFVVILVLLILSQTLWNHELFWIGFLVFLRKPQSFLISPRILKICWSLGRDLLGIYSRGRGEAIPQVSSIFVVVWLRFIVWIQVFGGFLGATGQTGRQDRSDRSASFWTAETGQTGLGISVLQFSRFASDLPRGFARSFEACCVGLAFP